MQKVLRCKTPPPLSLSPSVLHQNFHKSTHRAGIKVKIPLPIVHPPPAVFAFYRSSPSRTHPQQRRNCLHVHTHVARSAVQMYLTQFLFGLQIKNKELDCN